MIETALHGRDRRRKLRGRMTQDSAMTETRGDTSQAYVGCAQGPPGTGEVEAAKAIADRRKPTF